MLAFARVELGLTGSEFYRLTPRQFDAMARHHHQREKWKREHLEFLFGQLTAAVINFGFRSPQEPVAPKDFMPSRRDEPEGEEDPQVIADRIRRGMARIMARQNGKGNRHG